MEALVLVLALVGLGLLVLGVAFYVRLWSVLGMHRQAMHSLHQELAQRRVPRVVPGPPLAPNISESTSPPSIPHTRWRGPGTGI